jgi:S1-C subfamily serine protease
MVMSVDPKGPGAAADLRQGDIITKWSGQPIEDMKTIMRAMGPDSVGTTVQLSILRAGETAEASLTLSERPKA